jgi:hypothetical protein
MARGEKPTVSLAAAQRRRLGPTLARLVDADLSPAAARRTVQQLRHQIADGGLFTPPRPGVFAALVRHLERD